MRTHNGKGGSVKFPSDYLSRKELKAMNGEVVTYRLNDPMSWTEFKEMPNDIKVQYITAIRERFEAPDKYIAEMFGIAASTLQLYLKDLKCNVGKNCGNGNRKWNKDRFLAWRTGADETLISVEEESEPDEDRNETVEDSKDVVRACPSSGSLNFSSNVDDALNTIRCLLGNARVRLTIEWEVVEGE